MNAWKATAISLAIAVIVLLWICHQHREFISRYSLTYDGKECNHAHHHHRPGSIARRDATR